MVDLAWPAAPSTVELPCSILRGFTSRRTVVSRTNTFATADAIEQAGSRKEKEQQSARNNFWTENSWRACVVLCDSEWYNSMTGGWRQRDE